MQNSILAVFCFLSVALIARNFMKRFAVWILFSNFAKRMTKP